MALSYLMFNLCLNLNNPAFKCKWSADSSEPETPSIWLEPILGHPVKQKITV